MSHFYSTDLFRRLNSPGMAYKNIFRQGQVQVGSACVIGCEEHATRPQMIDASQEVPSCGVLARCVYATQEAPKVPGQRDDTDAQNFKR